jgi:coatomer subunit beta'
VHSPNGRLIVVRGDGEYIIYTAIALKNKSFDSALDFVWAPESPDTKGMYAMRESPSRIKLFKNFAEHETFRPAFPVETIFDGPLLAVCSNEFVDFYDWLGTRVVSRLEARPDQIFWAEGGELVVVACESAFFCVAV